MQVERGLGRLSHRGTIRCPSHNKNKRNVRGNQQIILPVSSELNINQTKTVCMEIYLRIDILKYVPMRTVAWDED